MVSDIILLFYSTQNSLKLKIKRIKKIFFSEIYDILTILEFYSSVHGMPAPQPFAARKSLRPAQNRPIAAAGT